MPGWVLVEHVVLADEQEPAMLAQDAAKINLATCCILVGQEMPRSHYRDIFGDILHHFATKACQYVRIKSLSIASWSCPAIRTVSSCWGGIWGAYQ